MGVNENTKDFPPKHTRKQRWGTFAGSCNTITWIRSYVAASTQPLSHTHTHTHTHTHAHRHTRIDTIPGCRAELLSWPELHQKSLIWERDGPQFQQAGIRTLRADSEFKDKMGWGCRFWNHPKGRRDGMDSQGGGEEEGGRWCDLHPCASSLCTKLPSIPRGSMPRSDSLFLILQPLLTAWTTGY